MGLNSEKAKKIEKRTGRKLEDILMEQRVGEKTFDEIRRDIRENTGIDVSIPNLYYWKEQLFDLNKATTTSMKRRATKEEREQYNKIIELLESIERVDVETQQKEKYYDEDKEDICMLIGDVHFGRNTESYNMNIAQNRCNRLIENTKKLIEGYISKDVHGFENIHILFLGDIIDGELVYEQQLHNIDASVLEQIRKAEVSLAPLLKWASNRFENVFVHTVRGNHGAGANNTSEITNWDTIFYEFLKRGLNQVDNLYFDISDRAFNNIDVRGHKIHMRHGEDAKPQSKTSSGERDMANWSDIHDWDMMVLGHYHFLGIDNYNSKLIYRNGAIVTDDRLSEKLGKKNEPRQWLFGVSDKRCPSFSYPIDLKGD